MNLYESISVTLPTASVKAAVYEEETELLFQESLEGSLLVGRSVTGGVTLQWRSAPREILSLLRKISERRSEIRDSCKPSEIRQCSVRETISDKSQQDREESGSVQCNQDEIFKTKVLQHDNDQVKSLTDCRQGNNSKNFMKSSSGFKNTELSNDKSKVDENGKPNERRSLKEAERGSLCEVHAVWSTEDASRNISKTGNVLSTSEINTCESVYTSWGSFAKERCAKSKEQSNVTCTSRLSNEVVFIEAPFLSPRLFQKSDNNTLSSSASSTVKLLISTDYIIVAILPLLAYVHHREKEEWQSLLFPVEVKSCCIAQGKLDVLLTSILITE